MGTIERYVLVDRDDVSQDYEYEDYREAVGAAGERDCAVIARQYEYTDSELVWTPDGGSVWPPKKRS